jgi:Tol biopolymer transport system component
MGVVYRAFDERLQRPVAIKVISPAPGDEAGIGRAIEEARAASALSHPNICTVFEVAEIDGRPYIAMEYVDGRPLSELIPSDGFPAETVVRYARQIGDALAHAHDRGVIHRDLKSANVVVGDDGRAKVLDFGLARRVAPRGSETDTRSLSPGELHAVAGTLAYLPPEVLLGQPGDARGDIWSFGVLLYEMASGSFPFRGRSEFEVTAAILKAPPEPLPAHVPPVLRAIIARCLSKEPSQRYQRAGEVCAALEAMQSDTAIRPVAADPRVRRRRLTGAAAVVALVGGAVYAGYLLRRPAESPWARLHGGRLIPVVSSQRPASDPALSPDGRMLVYAAEDERGRTDLYVVRISGGARVALTSDDGVEATPRFSPDGDYVAFTRRASAGGVPEVRIVPALGGDAVAVIPGAVAPAWSPDGKRMAFLRRASPDADVELVTSALDGSDPRTVLRGDSALPFLRNPAWSPSGGIAVVRGSGGISGEIWIVPERGGQPRRLTQDPPAVFSDWPAFTADGTGLVHASNRGGATNIWVQPVAGGAPVRVTTGPGSDESPTTAANGSVAFVTSRWRNELLVHPLAGEPTRAIHSHAPFIWSPAFSPDGREIAFSQMEVDGSWHVWSIPAAGGDPRRLTSGAGELYPRFSRDGAWLFFHTWAVPRTIGRLPAAGGAADVLRFGDGTSDAFADVSPDGARVVLARTDRDAERIYVAPAAGGDATLLTSTPGATPRWSPDGRLIAFGGSRDYTGGIFVVGPDGRGERRLTADGGWPVWWPDARRIAYIVATPGGSQEIRTVMLETGETSALPVLEFAGTNYPFDISRDASRLATSNGVHVSDEIWVLEPRRSP